jgi:uncharacterized protein (TIGR00369 family)
MSMAVPLLDLVQQARQSGDFSAFIAAIPYWRFMGLSARVEDGLLTGVLHYSDPLIGNPILPALHGGTIGALLETTAVLELFHQAETVVIPKTINLTVAYLRSGKPVDTFAKARITKQGRRIVSVQIEAWQDDRARPIASASANFLVTPAQ